MLKSFEDILISGSNKAYFVGFLQNLISAAVIPECLILLVPDFHCHTVGIAVHMHTH